jgi:hypothetical protein
MDQLPAGAKCQGTLTAHLTAAQVKTCAGGTYGSGNSYGVGLVPAAGSSNTTDFLRRDGTWAAAGGSGNGSGTVNSGDEGNVAYYAGDGTAVSDQGILSIHSSVNEVLISTGSPSCCGELNVGGTIGQTNGTTCRVYVRGGIYACSQIKVGASMKMGTSYACYNSRFCLP